jgi:hypothetical protein
MTKPAGRSPAGVLYIAEPRLNLPIDWKHIRRVRRAGNGVGSDATLPNSPCDPAGRAGIGIRVREFGGTLTIIPAVRVT